MSSARSSNVRHVRSSRSFSSVEGFNSSARMHSSIALRAAVRASSLEVA